VTPGHGNQADGRRFAGPVGSRVRSGVRWSLLSSVGAAVSQIPQTVVMSRLLTPRDFGLVAVGLVMLRFVSYFAQGGLSSALIQRPSIDRADVRAALALAVLASALGYGVFFLLAPVGKLILHDDQIVLVSRVLALAFVIAALGSVSTALLRRNLRLGVLSGIELCGQVVGSWGVGLTLALAGAGVWSLVGSTLAQGLITAVGSYAAVRHDLRPLIDWTRIRSFASFGALVSLTGFLEFLSGNLDVLVASRRFGAAGLGQYSRAWTLASLPLEHLSNAASKALFPAFSQLQEDTRRLRLAFIDSMAILVAVLGVAVTVAMVTATPGVHLLLGDQWSATAAVLPVVAAAAAVALLSHLPAVLAEALGRLRSKLAIQLTGLAVLVVMFWATSRAGGLSGVAFVVLLDQLLIHVLYLRLVTKIFTGLGRALLRIYTEVAILSLAVAAAGMAADRLFIGARPVISLTAQIVAMAGVLVALVASLRGRSHVMVAAYRRGLLRSRPSRSSTTLLD
jgi:O-antigen/teichoic acid export membrane protein